MKERPILFNAEMVRAVLDGRKTQTRRVVKNQNLDGSPPSSFIAYDFEDSDGECHYGFASDEAEWKCPYGAPGDLLWVRETWGYRGAMWSSKGSQEAYVTYHADGSKKSVPFKNPGDLQKSTPKQNIKYPPNFNLMDEWKQHSVEEQLLDDWWKRQEKKPSIHMPRWASRILLEVVSVKVERVQEITGEGAEAEGLQFNFGGNPINMEAEYQAIMREDFCNLWDSINAKREPENGFPYSWDANPWVWVVEFKRIGA